MDGCGKDVVVNLQDHAWRYFEFHANQRILLFRFYIAILVFLSSAIGFLFIRFYNPGILDEIAVITSSLILISVTVIFQLLDHRNCQLIAYAECALRDIEAVSNFTPESTKIFTREKQDVDDGKSLIGHKACFTLLYYLAYSVGVLACFFAIVSIICSSR